jgi:hypothetical protein
MIGILDTISQYAIPILTLSGMFLIARKVKWGFVLALLSQPFWFFTAYAHDQWGVFFNTVIYTGVLIYGAYNWFRTEKAPTPSLTEQE